MTDPTQNRLEHAGQERHCRLSMASLIGVLGMSLLVLARVSHAAWLSDDAFITLRYVSNTLSGHGAVFNPGDHVQGYTHPLWYLALLPGCWLFGDGVLVSIGYGLVLTLLTSVGLGMALHRAALRPVHALGVFVLGAGVLLSSDPWYSFQTSGLENSLSHFLILLVVAESFFHAGTRPGRLFLLLGLLCLTRPDFVLLGLPLALLLFFQNRSLRTVRTALLAGIPGIVWALFCWVYYGDVLPNTGAAKLAIYPSWVHSVKQGLRYVTDWCIYDSLAAAGTFAFLTCAVLMPRNRATTAVALGVVLHGLWVVWVGGDFMRGRFFTPALTASVVLGSMVLADRCRKTEAGIPYVVWLTCVGLFLVSAVSQTIGPSIRPRTTPRGAGIVDEREYYPGYSLRSYLRNGGLSNPRLDLGFADELRAYADECGPVTVHHRNPGTIGYLAGPKVTIIDTLGLTDRFIARLPRDLLTDPTPRPGHPDKYIPVSYLASRGDVSLVEGWEERIRQRDRSLKDEVAQYSNSRQFWAYGEGLVTRDTHGHGETK